jgi:hypothetical protein
LLVAFGKLISTIALRFWFSTPVAINKNFPARSFKFTFGWFQGVPLTLFLGKLQLIVSFKPIFVFT